MNEPHAALHHHFSSSAVISGNVNHKWAKGDLCCLDTGGEGGHAAQEVRGQAGRGEGIAWMLRGWEEAKTPKLLPGGRQALTRTLNKSAPRLRLLSTPHITLPAPAPASFKA